MVNVIVWARIFDRHAQLARAAPILGISGAVQVGKDGVTHVIAAALWDPMPQLQGDRADAPPPV
jgi:hypothetical protein